MKIGPHVILPTPAALVWARNAVIVKQLNATSLLQAAPASAIRIFRQSYANEGDTSSSAATVNACLAGLKGYTHPNLYLQLWTGAHPSRAILSAAVNLCHNLGFKTVGSSWFTGDYTQADWDDATAAGVDAYAPQCYWGNRGFTIDHALRYRQFWKPGQKPVMILECGRDAIEGAGGGWIHDKISAAQYVSECQSYNTEIVKDPYVLGATPFAAGPTSDWADYSTDPISALLIGGLPVSVPIVGPGLFKASPYIGPILESETYDAAGTDHEVSKIATPKGYANWSKATNETLVYVTDGRILADGGNHGDGSLKQVRGPFPVG